MSRNTRGVGKETYGADEDSKELSEADKFCLPSFLWNG